MLAMKLNVLELYKLKKMKKKYLNQDSNNIAHCNYNKKCYYINFFFNLSKN